MSVEALWAVEFVTDNGNYSAGVVVFETGRVLGGDSVFFYTGDFTLKDNTIQANIKVRHHGKLPPMSVWKQNDPEFDVRISGTFSESAISATATRDDEPGEMRMIFHRLEDLPSGIA